VINGCLVQITAIYGWHRKATHGQTHGNYEWLELQQCGTQKILEAWLLSHRLYYCYSCSKSRKCKAHFTSA